MNTATIVQKLWNYCNALRDDGMSYSDDTRHDCFVFGCKETMGLQVGIVPDISGWNPTCALMDNPG